MSCKNPNVDDGMANAIQSYTGTLSNENSNDSVFWSDYQEAQKNYGEKVYASESLGITCWADLQ